MPFYRLITKIELDDLIAKKYIEPSKESWPPYKSGQVICIYENNSVTTLFNKYCESIAEHRGLKLGDSIFVIELSVSSNIEIDKSQKGWHESRVYLGPIPVDKISIVAEAVVNLNKPGRINFNDLITYDKPKKWSIERNNFISD